MAGMLELSEQDFSKTMINTLRDLMEKVAYMQEQMDNVKRERKSKKESKRNNKYQTH